MSSARPHHRYTYADCVSSEEYDMGEKLEMYRTIPGLEEVMSSFWTPPAEAKEKVPPFFYARIHDLIVADPEMMAALTAPPAPSPAS